MHGARAHHGSVAATAGSSFSGGSREGGHRSTFRPSKSPSHLSSSSPPSMEAGVCQRAASGASHGGRWAALPLLAHGTYEARLAAERGVRCA